MTAKLDLPLSLKASTNIIAALISAAQPVFPKLPLPSMRRTISNVALHGMGRSRLLVMHRCMLHFLYCKRWSDHLSAHVPAPVATSATNFSRFLVPPSQSLEQTPRLVQEASTQSFSHASLLQAFVSDVSPQGFPPYFMAIFTSLRRWLTPPPQSALHLLQPLQVDNLQF